MSHKIPIRQASTDPFDRYVFDRPISVQHPKGTYGYTVISNLPKMAEQLHIANSQTIVKFLQKQLNTSATTSSTGVSFKGLFTPQQITEAVYAFIAQQVICKNCGLPELVHHKERMQCNACGHR